MEGQTGCVDVHGNGEGTGSLYLLHLGFNGFQIPGLHSGNAHTAAGSDGFAGNFHNGAVQTVTGESGDAALSAGLYQHVIVALVIVLVAVVGHHSAHRAGEEGITELLAEELQRCIGSGYVADGVHMDPDVQPLGIVAHGGVTDALGAGTGDIVAAGLAVADGTCLALCHGLTGLDENFLISHNGASLVFSFSIARKKESVI